ncbi:hypothetical protein MPSEU_000427400 [Mayamaea pseudoterrestris]|nr:hypothetical protein MPSEU_000427400 [Mayamaea pseudoterrestris]
MQIHEDVVRRRRLGSPSVAKSRLAEHSLSLNRAAEHQGSRSKDSRKWNLGHLMPNKKFTQQRVLTFILLVIMLFKVALLPVKTLLFGNGYSINGGLVGRFADSVLNRLEAKRRPRPEFITYPLVTERTRRHKIPGYSRFLEELLARHQSGRAQAATFDITTDEIHTQPMIRNTVVNIDSVAPTEESKVSLFHSTLAKNACRPGWICQRCLSSSRWGSLQACSSVCPACYTQLLCDAAAITRKKDKEWVKLQVQTKQITATRLIPRIIHQEFHEPIFAWQRPELHRFQNAWRAAGWDYRFYTTVMAREYVQRHYSSMVLHAYDKLAMQQQEQSDLFRLLVLLKDGGVYANIDTLLETNLDTLLSANTGFVAARDDSNDGSRDHCLWNGFIAAAPGHPFIVRVVEQVVTAVVQQWDEGDLECMFCLSRREPLWKMRAASLHDNIAGSCALGMTVHSLLGDGAFDQFRPDQIHMSNDILFGDTLIFMMSVDDTGAFRCSDIDRNVLVASTHHLGMTTETMQQRTRSYWLRPR